MKPATLISVATDPRISHRPAEAIRIAAGIGSWNKTDVTLLLRGPGRLILSEFTDDFMDEDNFSRYLPIVMESGRPVYVAESTDLTEILDGSPWKYEALTDEKIIQLYGQHHNFLHF
jgi:hypothetical protein